MARQGERQMSSLVTRGSVWLIAIAMLVAPTGACSGPHALEQAADARQLATALQAEFSQAVEVSHRAVMSESDPASGESAREAEQARERVKSTERKLNALLVELQYANERKLLEEFHAKFAAYEALDATILGLAVEKSNIKASRLAFGPAREAADSFKLALSKLPSRDAKLRTLVLEAELAVREIQTLEPPHIAEPNDAVMTRMEQQMASLEAAARGALEQLASSTDAPELKEARLSFDRFTKTNADIVSLSRRNTNVRSLELTLGQKRKVVATCEASLRAVRDALVERAQRPTR